MSTSAVLQGLAQGPLGLVDAQHAAAMLTTFNEIDLSAVMQIRSRRRESFQERYGVTLGYTSFFVKAVIGALKFMPRLNGEIEGEEIILRQKSGSLAGTTK